MNLKPLRFHAVSLVAVCTLATGCGGGSSTTSTGTTSTGTTSTGTTSTGTTSTGTTSTGTSSTGTSSTGTSSTGTSGSSSAPSGTVVSVSASSFVLDSGGTDITVDTVSGSTYQNTVDTTASAATVGGYVAGLGSVSNGQLNAVDLAFVPTPPSVVTAANVETTSGGTIYWGQITAVSNGVLTISAGSAGTLLINTASATTVTQTTNSDFQAITVGETVEVNGPEVSATEYTGHQINIGVTPSVVGQFD